MRTATRTSLLSLTLAIVLALACEPAADDGDAPRTAGDTASDSAAHAAPGDTTAREEMELRGVMSLLGSHMSALSHALWREDWPAIERRAASIANHPRLTADETARIEAALGRDMSGFEEADEAMHDAARRMHAASRVRNADSFLDALADVQRGCVQCHDRFRARVREAGPRSPAQEASARYPS